MGMACLKYIILFIFFMALSPCFASYSQQQDVESAFALSAGKLLPRTVIPSHYKLKLEPHLADGYFNGIVEIDVICQELTNTVMLHSHENLSINNDEITVRSDATGENLSIANIHRNETADLLIIVLQDQLHHGATYKFHIPFNSNFSGSGFFREKDGPLSGEEKWYGVTLSYPRKARHVFPCFDEPSFKATFQISVARSNNMTALSMMPLDHTEPAEKEGWVWDTFAVSPPISTYAVAIVVAPLDSEPPVNVPNKGGNLILQFHHKRNYSYPYEPGFNLTANIHHFIENMIEFLDVAYPLPKIDVVFLPGYFEAENSVGLLIGREKHSDGARHFMQGFALHYFTQVSTPQGWPDFRILNLLSSYLADKVWFQMLDSEVYYRLFYLNRFRVNYKRLYDTPHYTIPGGEWIFSMLNSSLTEHTLRLGLAKLIIPNNSESFTAQSVWTVLTEQGRTDGTLVGSVNISTIAKSWLESKCQCFPVMTVTRNYDENSASLKQDIFFQKLGHNTTQEEEETVWWIPFEYLEPQKLNPSNIHAVAWMGGKHLDVTNLPDSDSFIIANPMSSGYFLVNYDHHNWELISQYLLTHSSHLPRETRGSLLVNAFHLANGGQLSYTIPLNLTLSLHNETDTFVWHSFLSVFESLRNRCHWSPIADKINNYMLKLMSRMYESTNDIDDVIIENLPLPEQTVAAGKKIIRIEMCLMKHQPCANKMNEYLTKEMSTFEVYDNITQLHIFCPEFVRSASADWLEGFIKFLSFLKNRRTHYQRVAYMSNLEKCPGYEHIVEKILNDIFDNSLNLSRSDWFNIERLFVENPTSHNISLNFFLQHLDRMNETTPEFKNVWPGFLNSLISRMITYNFVEKIMEIQEHYGNRLSADIMRRLNFSLHEARDAAIWYNKNAVDIENWLENVPPLFNIND